MDCLNSTRGLEKKDNIYTAQDCGQPSLPGENTWLSLLWFYMVPFSPDFQKSQLCQQWRRPRGHTSAPSCPSVWWVTQAISHFHYSLVSSHWRVFDLFLAAWCGITTDCQASETKHLFSTLSWMADWGLSSTSCKYILRKNEQPTSVSRPVNIICNVIAPRG